MSAEFATIVDGTDLYEISDGRLRFKNGKSGIITAKFMVPQQEKWRKIRLTYRRPGKGLRLENYVIARLNQINRLTLASETLTFASSQNHIDDSDEIRSILGVNTLLDALDYANFFYHIEIVMRRSPILVFPDQVVKEAITFSGINSLARKEEKAKEYKEPDEKQTAKSPSVPIPPPTDSEISTLKSLIDFGAMIKPEFGILTPSPEFILVELANTAPGFG